MRYFVTGGAGFIGSNFVEYLFENVSELTGVTIFDKFTYAANPKNYEKFLSDSRLKVIKGDVCDLSLLEESMKDHDFVIHFAAESHVDRSIDDASAFVQTNVLGAFNVLEASRKTKIKTIIHVSTDEVYGSLAEGSADETHPLLPNSPYAASKAASDLLGRSYFETHGLDVRTTRCCNNYGKYQFPEKVIPVFIKNLLQGKNLPIYGDGTNVREWIHVSDHSRGIQCVLENGIPGEIYNIGTGNYLSNNELAESLASLMGSKNSIKQYVQDRKGHDFRYSVDFTKIARLGFKSQIDFESGIQKTLEWYVDNTNWWGPEDELTQNNFNAQSFTRHGINE
jgi:dTDP-glucose 4,6-dehydratase